MCMHAQQWYKCLVIASQEDEVREGRVKENPTEISNTGRVPTGQKAVVNGGCGWWLGN